jgi:hypothetical protein
MFVAEIQRLDLGLNEFGSGAMGPSDAKHFQRSIDTNYAVPPAQQIFGDRLAHAAAQIDHPPAAWK